MLERGTVDVNVRVRDGMNLVGLLTHAEVRQQATRYSPYDGLGSSPWMISVAKGRP